jgi:hypothetical protein
MAKHLLKIARLITIFGMITVFSYTPLLLVYLFPDKPLIHNLLSRYLYFCYNILLPLEIIVGVTYVIRTCCVFGFQLAISLTVLSAIFFPKALRQIG